MSRTNKVRPTINVTPLVDVVLVLLIIFMVVTPMMESGIALDLPKARHPDPEPKGMDPIAVSVGADGSVLWSGRPVSLEVLSDLLEQQRRVNPGRPVLLQADRKTAFRKVREVFRRCRDAGLSGVALKVTAPQEGE